MKPTFHVIIPARYASTRFPAKLLADLGGQTVIQRVYRQALASGAASVLVATDSQDILTHVHQFGGQAIMTSTQHQSGSDRLAEAVRMGSYAKDDLIVNVQGDEPFIEPELILQVAETLAEGKAPVATLCWPIQSQVEMFNPNIVKVVRNVEDQALYFSRAPIPFNRDADTVSGFRHIGLYAYRAAFLLEYVSWPVAEIERIEALEQLRILAKGYPVHVPTARVQPKQDINTLDDLIKARELV